MVTRRGFLTQTGLIGAGLGIAIYSYQLERMKNQPYLVRPPGALSEDRFLGTCMKCGQCAESCPYEAIRLAGASKGVAIGTPYLLLRERPCYLCPGFPCIKACPSGALDPTVTEPNQVKMGLAVLLGREDCIALKGFRCEVCYRVCPLLGKAITLDIKQGGSHIIFEPVTHKESCVGCGLCEHACILEVAAIKIIPQAEIIDRRLYLL